MVVVVYEKRETIKKNCYFNKMVGKINNRYEVFWKVNVNFFFFLKKGFYYRIDKFLNFFFLGTFVIDGERNTETH